MRSRIPPSARERSSSDPAAESSLAVSPWRGRLRQLEMIEDPSEKKDEVVRLLQKPLNRTHRISVLRIDDRASLVALGSARAGRQVKVPKLVPTPDGTAGRAMSHG